MPLLSLTSKGKTLQALAPLARYCRVLPVLMVSVGDVSRNLQTIINAIQEQIIDTYLVVRSSALAEDNLSTSNAGHFRSVLNVCRDDRKALEDALKSVVASYGACSNDEELFVQPMLGNIDMAGVAFTADADTLAPYYIINYDESGRSDTITSGQSGQSKTYIHFKRSPIPPSEPILNLICAACRELEELSGNNCLDIEFAVSNRDVYVLQVRPITRHGKENLSSLDLSDALFKIHRKVEKLSAPHPNLLGSKAIFGVMPDWNPAEIIGLRPRQLALSLYKELVTDSVWAYQRDNYGYRNLRSHPLLVSFLGMPYIDVRVDFNSFIPKALDDQIAAKLVDYYIDRLDTSPELHDKVEFEIVHSCYYLTLPEKLENLREHGFNANEIKRIEFALLELTNTIVDPVNGLYKKDLQRVNELTANHAAILSSNLTVIEKIYWLVEYCKRYGTLPFAGVARAAFIAVQFLGSFVEASIMTVEDRGLFLGSLNTVAKQLQTRLCRLASGDETREEFLEAFGHLRPGTYDILSPCYGDNFEQYFSKLPEIKCPVVTYDFSDEQKKQIDLSLRENGLQIRAEDLLRFIVESIEGREYAKLVFTRTLSDVLRLITEMGDKYGVSHGDVSYLDIRTILNLYSSLDHRNLKDILLADISVNRDLHAHTRAVKLPSLIRTPSDVYGFFLEAETPNFVTLGRVVAETALEAQIETNMLAGKIVFIRAADPGYDFLFTRQIAGLVTQFGGANSHMAIRCAELGIPAIIGAGEKNFSDWSKAHTLEIDCSGRQVRILL
jgi:phosphohistidine swiveling domain-containing protein